MDLPDELLVQILNHLPVRHLIGCRPACKQWRDTIDQSVRKDEVIVFIENRPRPLTWEYNGQSVDLNNSIQVYSNFMWSSERCVFGLIFKNVKRLLLSFNLVWSPFFLENALLAFKQLEHLQVLSLESEENIKENYRFGARLCNTKYEPVKLRTLYFPNLTSMYSKLIDIRRCQNLEHVNVNNKLAFGPVIANRLRFLAVFKMDYSEAMDFPNLRVLACSNPPTASQIDLYFPSLVEFHFLFHKDNSLTDIRSKIEAFLIELKKPDFICFKPCKVFWFGIQWQTIDDLDKLQLFKKALTYYTITPEVLKLMIEFEKSKQKLNFRMFGYGKYQALVYTDALGELLQSPLMKIPLLKRIKKNLQHVVITRFIQDDHLLASCSMFDNVLMFTASVRLEQRQFDRLPEVFEHLRVLNVFGRFFEKETDFSFIARFANLWKLRKTKMISIGLLKEILAGCQFFELAKFREANYAFYFVRDDRTIVRQFQKCAAYFLTKTTEMKTEKKLFNDQTELLKYLTEHRLVTGA